MMDMALSGIKILDMTVVYSGPIATMQLADYGAEVIKIEPPQGEVVRYMEPQANGANAFFPNVNRNKKGITLNVKTEKGRKIFLELVKNADVVVENYRAGTLKKLGLDYETLKEANPKIIVASLSGFGETGPNKDKSCYSMLAEAYSGVMSMTGSPDDVPYTTGVAFGDSVGGMFTALGIMIALYHREKTGEGQYIDVAMVDSLIALSQGGIGEVDVLGEDLKRVGNRDTGGYPYDVYEAKDGYCALSVANPNDWSGFAKACDLEHLIDDPRFLTNKDRWNHADELQEYINQWTRKHTRAEIEKVFNEYREGYAPVLTTQEMMQSEQALSREMVIEVEDPVFGKMKQAGFPIKMSKTPASIRKGAPLVGEDNLEIYTELGYSQEEINTLKEEGIL